LKQVNLTLGNSAVIKSKYGTGVHLMPETGKFKAYIGMFGKLKHIGVYDTQIEAVNAYLNAKIDYINLTIHKYNLSKEIAHGFKKHIKILKREIV